MPCLPFLHTSQSGISLLGNGGLSRDYDERSRENVDEAEACGMIQEKELAYGCQLIGDDTHMYSRQTRGSEF
jgi:hypothetical protein